MILALVMSKGVSIIYIKRKISDFDGKNQTKSSIFALKAFSGAYLKPYLKRYCEDIDSWLCTRRMVSANRRATDSTVTFFDGPL